MTRATLLALAFTMVTAAGASAQGRFEVSGGGAFTGGVDFGRQEATLTPNSTTGGAPTVLFRTDSSLEGAVGVQGRLGFALTSSLTLEGGVRFTRPVLRIRATDDFEDADDVNADETLSDYLFDGSAVWHFGDASSARAVPFVFGGAGYFRSLHEGSSVVEDGLEYHAGGGLKWWFGSGASRFGLRVDASMSVRARGELDLDDGSRVVPVATGSLVWRF
jgi:hypothetical protein